MASDDVQTNLRLPADLKEQLVAAAAASNRSLSAEVVSRIQASFERDRTIEKLAMENGFATTQLKLEIERLTDLLQATRPLSEEQMEEQAANLAVKALPFLYAEAEETIAAARQAVEDLKAAGKWPPTTTQPGLGVRFLKVKKS